MAADDRLRRNKTNKASRLAHDELYRISLTDTPYGLVMVERAIAGKSGEITFALVNPFALLQLACQRHKLWAHFFN